LNHAIEHVETSVFEIWSSRGGNYDHYMYPSTKVCGVNPEDSNFQLKKRKSAATDAWV